MTYMYSGPQYIKLATPKIDQEKFGKYSLNYYTETSKPRRFYGQPVLYIPGNAGSMKQVRSLASISLQISKKPENENIIFDYFAADFNEELTAGYGALAFRQVEYVGQCLRQILNYYPKDKAEIIIVGHSMGGLIARAVSYSSGEFFDFKYEKEIRNKIKFVITLATPHVPVLVSDIFTAYFYNKLNRNNNKHNSKGTLFPPIISISGGSRDTNVRSDLTLPPGLKSGERNSNWIQTTTYDMPKACLSADHKAIVWCRQVVLQIARSLFDMIKSDNPLTPSNFAGFLSFSEKKRAQDTFLNTAIDDFSSEFTPVEVDEFLKESNSKIKKTVYRYHIKEPHNNISIWTSSSIERVLLCKQTNNNNNNNNNNDYGHFCKSLCNLNSKNCEISDITLKKLELPFSPQNFLGVGKENRALKPERVNGGRPLSFINVNTTGANVLIAFFNEKNDEKSKDGISLFTQIGSENLLQSSYPYPFSTTKLNLEILKTGIIKVVFSNKPLFKFLIFSAKFLKSPKCECKDSIIGIIGENEICRISQHKKGTKIHLGKTAEKAEISVLLSCCSYEMVIEIDYQRTCVVLFQSFFIHVITVITSLVLFLFTKFIVKVNIHNLYHAHDRLSFFDMRVFLEAIILSLVFSWDVLPVLFISIVSTGFLGLLCLVFRILLCLHFVRANGKKRKEKTHIPKVYVGSIGLLSFCFALLFSPSIVIILSCVIFLILNIITISNDNVRFRFITLVLLLCSILCVCEAGEVVTYFKAVFIEKEFDMTPKNGMLPKLKYNQYFDYLSSHSDFYLTIIIIQILRVGMVCVWAMVLCVVYYSTPFHLPSTFKNSSENFTRRTSSSSLDMNHNRVVAENKSSLKNPLLLISFGARVLLCWLSNLYGSFVIPWVACFLIFPGLLYFSHTTKYSR